MPVATRTSRRGTAGPCETTTTTALQFHWVRKRYSPAAGLSKPDPILTSDAEVPIDWMDSAENWGTTRFADPADLRHDMHVNIVTFEPGGRIPFAETHVMEHGIYVLEGTAEYLLNRDWVSVAAGRLHLASRLLPAGVHRDGQRSVPVPALQGREQAPRARRAMTAHVRIEPLTAAAFVPYGDVLEAAGTPDRIINEGLCERFHDRARLDFGPDGRAGISVFRAEPRSLPLTLALVERHPEGSQAFIPMSADPFLVIVAADVDGQPADVRAFRTAPGQGVNLLRNTWHGVLTPLTQPGIFAVIDRIGPTPNLEEHRLAAPLVISD